jgi:hypothetical protein
MEFTKLHIQLRSIRKLCLFNIYVLLFTHEIEYMYEHSVLIKYSIRINDNKN